MKKSILLVAVIFSVAVIFTSCKETKKEEVKVESHEGHDHDAEEEVAANAVYKCPMDCEKGKTYDEAGACPVCKMDLKTASVDLQKHAEGCTCISDGGECTCEPGKCQCLADNASAVITANEASKCGSKGNCACKA